MCAGAEYVSGVLQDCPPSCEDGHQTCCTHTAIQPPRRKTTTVDTDEIEDLSKRLQNDLRGHIRNLGDYELLSSSWVEMAKSLRRIGDITRMEVEIEKESKDATLWVCDEVALRFLLEDGKLNLCLRNLVRTLTLIFMLRALLRFTERHSLLKCRAIP